MRLTNLTEGLEKTWGSVAEGWNNLVHRASSALTHFSDKDSDNKVPIQNPSWGLLSADVYDDADKLTVRLEVPGLEAENFDLNVVDNVLIVSGEKSSERNESKGEYRIMERAYGHFSRSIPLGYEVDTNSAKASYKNGILQVELEKQPDQRRRHITVH